MRKRSSSRVRAEQAKSADTALSPTPRAGVASKPRHRSPSSSKSKVSQVKTSRSVSELPKRPSAKQTPTKQKTPAHQERARRKLRDHSPTHTAQEIQEEIPAGQPETEEPETVSSPNVVVEGQSEEVTVAPQPFPSPAGEEAEPTMLSDEQGEKTVEEVEQPMAEEQGGKAVEEGEQAMAEARIHSTTSRC